eukprot:5743221-Amphidinium_carterae.2
MNGFNKLNGMDPPGWQYIVGLFTQEFLPFQKNGNKSTNVLVEGEASIEITVNLAAKNRQTVQSDENFRKRYGCELNCMP